MPPLRGPDGLRETAEGKAELLFQTHFPPPPVVDLSDIDEYEYPASILDGPELTSREFSRALRKTPPDRAPGPNGVPNRIIRLCEPHAIQQIRSLFQASLDQGIQPARFKVATTIMLRKPGAQRDYTDPKTYRSIALLDTLGKALESIVSERIRYTVKVYGTLPATQMGARK